MVDDDDDYIKVDDDDDLYHDYDFLQGFFTSRNVFVLFLKVVML